MVLKVQDGATPFRERGAHRPSVQILQRNGLRWSKPSKEHLPRRLNPLSCKWFPQEVYKRVNRVILTDSRIRRRVRPWEIRVCSLHHSGSICSTRLVRSARMAFPLQTERAQMASCGNPWGIPTQKRKMITSLSLIQLTLQIYLIN